MFEYHHGADESLSFTNVRKYANADFARTTPERSHRKHFPRYVAKELQEVLALVKGEDVKLVEVFLSEIVHISQKLDFVRRYQHKKAQNKGRGRPDKEVVIRPPSGIRYDGLEALRNLDPEFPYFQVSEIVSQGYEGKTYLGASQTIGSETEYWTCLDRLVNRIRALPQNRN